MEQENIYSDGLTIDGNKGKNILNVNKLFTENIQGIGVRIAGIKANMSMSDIIVRKSNKQINFINKYGLGILIYSGASLDLNKAIVELNDDYGIAIDGKDTIVKIMNLLIKNTTGNYYNKQSGIGLTLQKLSTVEIKKAIVTGNHHIGILAIDEAELNLEDIKIINTKQTPCKLLSPNEEYYCPNEGAGYGLASILNSKITFKNLQVKNNDTLGIQMARNGTIKGDKIEIANHNIAFNIQEIPESYDFNREVTGLIMTNNTINFDNQELKVPSVLDY